MNSGKAWEQGKSKLQRQPLTTGYGSSRPTSTVPAHSYTGGCIRLVALITHMGGHRHKLPCTVTGHIDNTIGYDTRGLRVLVLLTLRVVVIWRKSCHLQFMQGTICFWRSNKWAHIIDKNLSFKY